MPRPIWKGPIAFGLVSIPVRLVSAVRDRTIRFNMLSPDGSCRLRQKLYCPETGKEYDFAKASRGYEIAPDQYVIIDRKELKRLRPDAGRLIDIVTFSPLAAVDPIYFDRAYYLEPEEGGAKAYALLVAAMEATGRVAIGRFVMREREHLAAIRPRGKALVLHTLHFDEEVIPVSDLGGLGRAPARSAKEMKLTEELITALDDPFDPSTFRNEYREELRKVIKARASGKKVVHAAAPDPEAAPRGDLMEVLRASLDRASGSEKSSRAPRKRGTQSRRGAARKATPRTARSKRSKRTSKRSGGS